MGYSAECTTCIDSAASGSKYFAAASPSLAHLLRQAAIDVPHPNDDGRTLWDARLDQGNLTGPADSTITAGVDEQTTEANEGAQLADTAIVAALGSGSDFTVMLERLGVSTLPLKSKRGSPN